MTQGPESICVHVRMEAQLRGLLAENPHRLNCPQNSSVMDALHLLCDQPEIRPRLFSDANEISGSLLVFRNGIPVARNELATTRLGNEDEILLFPPISGG